jgi:PAS domain-containing protein
MTFHWKHNNYRRLDPTVLWNSAKIYDKNGVVVATVAQGQDITERKQIENELRKSKDELERRFRSGLQNCRTTRGSWSASTRS